MLRFLEKLLLFGQAALLGLGQQFKFGLAFQTDRFAMPKLPDFGFQVGTPSLQVDDRLVGGLGPFFEASPHGLSLVEAEKPGESGSENGATEGGEVGKIFHGEIVPCELG